MTKLSKVLVVIGCLLIMIGIVSKFASCPTMIGPHLIKPISFVLMANTALLLALLLKK